MKPYLAILIDSFHEAVGNRVLWALLLGWTLVLAALAPFGYISERSWQLSSFDISDREQLIKKLAKGVQEQGKSEIVAAASRLDQDFQQRLLSAAAQDSGDGQRRISAAELARELNSLLEQPDLYSAEDYPTAQRRKRLQPLIESVTAGSPPEVDVEELNRELLQLAFPLELSSPQGEQLWVGYASFKIGEALPISRRQIKQFIEPLLLGTIIKLGLGILAVFVAIVVTSPIIPDTFRSGSLHLLLSKPISRVWLYLAKFFGGCIFVLVNITYVLIGLFLIAGLRFDIWNTGLLLCVPLLMFVFVIFYSVSGLVGLIWNNAIVSVVACMLFWLFCFSIGFMHDAMLPQVEVLPQIRRIAKVEDHLMSVNERGELNVWNAEFEVWQPAYEAEVPGSARTFGPIYNEERRMVIAKSFFRVPFRGLQARSRSLSLIRLGDAPAEVEAAALLDGVQTAEAPLDLPSEGPAVQAAPTEQSAEISNRANRTSRRPQSDQLQSASEARETPRWMPEPGPELPTQLFEIIEMGDAVLAVCRGGLYKLDPDSLDRQGAAQGGLFGIKLPFLNVAFKNIAPKDYFLSENSRAAATQAGDGLIVFSSGSLDHLAYDGQTLSLVQQVQLDGDGTEAALLQMNSEYCVVARDGLPIQIRDAQLQLVAEVELPTQQKVRQMAWIPETSDLAIISHSGDLYRLDCQAVRLSPLAPGFSAEVTCMNWAGADKVWLGLKPDGVGLLDVPTATIVEAYTPRPTTLDRVYRWLVKPIYTVNPKPAALDNAMGYLLSGNDTVALSLITNDLEAAQMELNLWGPLISNLLFVTAILGFSCYYVARKEY